MKYLGIRVDCPSGKMKNLQGYLNKSDFADLKKKLRATTPGGRCSVEAIRLSSSGKARWFKVVARTIWDSDEDTLYSGTIGKFIDIHEEQMELTNLKRLASQDSLTGLFNHKAAKEMIENMISSARE